MSSLPSVCIITAAAMANANLVWAAMGRGPDTFSVQLTTDNPATETSTVTHYLMADSSSQAEDVAAWQAFAEGVLPAIDGVWGQDGVIAEADAIAAVGPDNLQVYSASGDVTPADHVAAILLSRNLRKIPDPI